MIHSAGGGVDLAVFQHAPSIDVEIFAMVSLSKHNYLQSVGVQFISTSRYRKTFVSQMSVVGAIMDETAVCDTTSSLPSIGAGHILYV